MVCILLEINLFWFQQSEHREVLTFFVPNRSKTLNKKVINRVKELFEEVIEDTSFFLVDVEFKGGPEPVVWIYVDAENEDVTLDQCADLSRELGFLMDANGVIKGRYRLNVSTPGLSRPLQDPRQFKKNVGRRLRVKFKEQEEYQKVEGELKEFAENELIIQQDDEHLKHIAYEDVVQSKVIPVIN